MKKFFSVLFFAIFMACTATQAQSTGFSQLDNAVLFDAEKTEAPTTFVDVFPSAESIPAGNEFTLLVKVSMQPHWHVYWKNPGEVGLPPSIEWANIPAGVTFGEWQWSAPKFYELQGIASYVYEDVGYIKIPVKISEEVPVGQLKLSGAVSWLACDDNGCYPKDGTVSIAVKVVPASEKSVPANALLFAESEKAFPKNDETLASVFSEKIGSVELRVRKEDGKGLSETARFFPESPKFSSAAASVSPKKESDGTLVFSLPTVEKLDLKNDTAGVLVVDKGTAYQILPTTSGVSDNATASVDSSFFALLLLAFAGGLILNLMPCVFPVLGLKIMHFVGKAGSDKKKIIKHGFVFAAGVILSFWLLAGVLVVLRSGGEQLGWGFQLQEPAFVYGMVLVLFVFGLVMSGVFEFGVGATSIGGSLGDKTGYSGSFFSGVLAVIVATPCAAPFLAPALGSALTLPLIPSFALFTMIAVGLALPYVVLSCVPSLLRFLPKPGAWMETFKQAMAFLLYAPALYFVWVLMGQVEDVTAQRDLLISFSVIALACWIYGRWGAVWRARGTRILGTLIALVLFAGTIFYVSGLLYEKKTDDWVAWTFERQERALNEGKIVYVDFTARWCATCQANKFVYSSENLQKKFAAANVIKMRADWTNKNPEIAAELQKYGRAAVPVNVFLKKGSEPVILGELFAGPGTVIDGLEKIHPALESK